MKKPWIYILESAASTVFSHPVLRVISLTCGEFEENTRKPSSHKEKFCWNLSDYLDPTTFTFVLQTTIWLKSCMKVVR